ncbi:hypothetical protein HDF11_001910 [Tunturiibacter psychrotolerans]
MELILAIIGSATVSSCIVIGGIALIRFFR